MRVLATKPARTSSRRSTSPVRRHIKSESETPRPTRPLAALITEYQERWTKLDKYPLQEASLGLLFRTLCPRNENIEHVLLKVSALNDFYSTNIFDAYSVAKHILTKDVDSRLEANDYALVNDVAKITIRGKAKNFYSFATKYCSHHKPESYPIFDSFVERLLLHYKMVDGFSVFTKTDLREYPRFIGVIKDFQHFYGLEKFSLKEIDVYLWQVAKACFPKKY